MNLSATSYHQTTSYHRHRMDAHFLDWHDQPSLYKVYPHREILPLDRDVSGPDIRISSLFTAPMAGDSFEDLTLRNLSQILWLTYRVTTTVRYGTKAYFFRNVPSAGALYPSEIYLTSKGVEGLRDGLYYFPIASHGLVLLREGEFSDYLLPLIDKAPQVPPALCFFFSAIFYRSAWKYRDRAYRYHLLDTGHLMENLSLAHRSLFLPMIWTYDFDDERLNHFLGLDEDKEVCLAMALVPGKDHKEQGASALPPSLSEKDRQASRVARNIKEYPRILEIHRGGYKRVSGEKERSQMWTSLGVTSPEWLQLSLPSSWKETYNYPQTLLQRRSRRNFARRPLPSSALGVLIAGLTSEDWPKDTLAMGMLVGQAEGLEPGFYGVDIATRSLGLVSRGLMMDEMASACLDQKWLSMASIHFLFLANLGVLDRDWGSRGYRYAMMAAGRLCERIYLMSTAMGLGCCGIGALYDDEAAAFLGLNVDSRLLYLVAVGPVRGHGPEEGRPHA